MATAKSKQRLAAMLLSEIADSIKAGDCSINEFVDCIDEVALRVFPDYAVSVGFIPQDELNEVLNTPEIVSEVKPPASTKTKAPKTE